MTDLLRTLLGIWSVVAGMFLLGFAAVAVLVYLVWVVAGLPTLAGLSEVDLGWAAVTSCTVGAGASACGIALLRTNAAQAGW